MGNQKVFPEFSQHGTSPTLDGGLTLRQYYAAEAMKGLLSNGDFSSMTSIVQISFLLADQMIAFEQKEVPHD